MVKLKIYSKVLYVGVCGMLCLYIFLNLVVLELPERQKPQFAPINSNLCISHFVPDLAQNNYS